MFNRLVKALGIVLFFGGNFGYNAVLAQNIIPNNDGVNTNVNFDSLNNTFNIDGGTISGNNLFHSFQQFGLDNGQIANFLSQPNILNILSRINGGNPSIINGIINSNANLFLMNPAGIIFGQNASLNINGDFTATTATGIGFESGFFNNIGTNDYNSLIGNPVSYKFEQTGGIIYNETSLEANNLSLLGNTVINDGNLTALNGNILISGVSETGLLTVSFPNSLISWEISAPTDDTGNLAALTVENFLNAIKGKDNLGVTVNENNQLVLGSSGLNITPENGQIISTGDIKTINNNSDSELNSGDITLNADSDITLNGDLNTASQNATSGTINIISKTGNIILNNVDIGSNTGVDNPLNINTSGEVQLLGELTPRGATVNIGNVTPVSNFIATNFINTQGGDFNLNTSGNYTFNTNLFTLGGNANIISNGDLIINSNWQTFGGNINLNGVNLDIINSNLTPDGGNVNLTAINGIVGTDINTQGGDININGGNITLENLVTSDDLDTVTRSSGNVNIQGNNISLSGIDTRTTIDSDSGINAGNINLIAENDITINGNNSEGDIISSSVSVGGLGNAGNITIQSNNGNINFAENFFLISSTTPTDNPNNSGEISLNADNGEINLPDTIEIQNFSNSGNTAPLQIIANSINGNNLSLVFSDDYDLGNLNLSGDLDIVLNDGKTITNSAPINVGGNLTFEDLTGNNSSLLLDNPNNNLNTVTIISAQETIINDIDNIVLDGINSNTLEVTANNINQTNSITSNDVNLSAINDINLDNSNNQITNLNATGNNITINNSENLNFTGIESETLNVIAPNINQSNSLSVNDINLTTTGDINLSNSNNTITNLTATGNNITVNNAQNITLNEITSNNSVNISAIGDINQNEKIKAQSLFFQATNDINLTNLGNEINQVFLLGENVTLNNTNNLDLGFIESNIFSLNVTGDINLTEQININEIDFTATGNINLVNPNNTMESLKAKANIINVSNGQDLILKEITANSLILDVLGDITQNEAIIADNINLTATGDIILENSLNQIDQYSLFANSVTVTNPNNINLEQIITNGGNIKVTGNNITAQNSLISYGGNIELTATENINTQSINASNFLESQSLENRENIEQGGTITLKGDNITTENINSFGVQGGDIIVQAQTTIITGAIDSSGSVGDGGNVSLDPTGDIEVTSINSQGGENGQGGDVNIETDSFFRATGTILDSNMSIATEGGTGGGSITIKHGGNGETPFVVGDPAVNGTAGMITSGNAEISNGSFLFTTKNDNIEIISVNQIPIEINPAINEEKIEEEAVEENISNPVTTLTNVPPIKIKTITQTRQILNQVQSTTGTKPALIYINFTPKNISLKDDFVQRENQLTNEFENYLNPNKKNTVPVITKERSDDDILELIIVTETDNIRYVIEDATRNKVLELNNLLRREISTPFGNTQRLLTISQKLYEWLIQPLETDLNTLEINNLVFVMDDGLRTLPLAALHDGNNYIIEKYSVGLMPSLSLVDTTYTPIKDLGLLAMGASTFTDQNPLPAVPTELNIITSQIWQGQSFLNQDFTIDNLKLARKNAPVGILHLATHGEFNPGKPENSYIQFGDRRLSLDELAQLRLNRPAVELMVLSACKTALGDNDSELGFAGLAHQAGVKTALGSLWYVSDEGTLGLMSNFYQQLLTAPIKAEALREAQLSMLRGEVRLENGKLVSGDRTFDLPPSLLELGNKDLKHPFYWSAFTMIGNPW